MSTLCPYCGARHTEHVRCSHPKKCLASLNAPNARGWRLEWHQGLVEHAAVYRTRAELVFRMTKLLASKQIEAVTVMRTHEVPEKKS